MKKTKKKSLIIAGLCATTSVTVSYLMTRLFVKTALDREIPNAMKHLLKRNGNLLSGCEKSEEYLKEYAICTGKLAQSENEELEIRVEDGTTLKAHYIPVKNPKRIIIAFHGWRSAWYYDFGMISDFWKSNDCSVIYVEQRGQKNSGGDHMGFGIIERNDCQCWARWVSENISKEIPIYLAGVSMGATTVLLASELKMPENVCGIMADCGFTSPDAIWKHIAEDNLHLQYRAKRLLAGRMYHNITKGDSKYSTIDAVKKTNLPIMFIHGASDNFVPVVMSIDNYNACKSKKKLLIVPGADHCMSYYMDKDGYETMTKEFWNENDRIC